MLLYISVPLFAASIRYPSSFSEVSEVNRKRDFASSAANNGTHVIKH